MFDKSNSNQKHIGLKTMIALAIIALAAPLALSFGAVGRIMSYRGVESLLPKAVTVTVNSVAEAMGNKFEVYNALGREIANEDELVNPELTEKQKQSFLDNKAREYNLSAAIYLDAKGVSADGTDCSSSNFYVSAMTGNTTICAPETIPVSGEFGYVVSSPVRSGSEIVGVAALVVPLDAVSSITEISNVSENGFTYLIDKNGGMVMHPDLQFVKDRENVEADAAGNSELSSLASIHARARGGETGYGAYSYNGEKRLIAYAPVSNTDGWSICVVCPLSDFTDSAKDTVLILAILLVVFILYGAWGTRMLIRRIAEPVNICVSALDQMAKGDFHTPLPQANAKSQELYDIQSHLDVMRNYTNSVIADVSYVLCNMADGDFTATAKVPECYQGDFTEILEAERTIRDNLSDAVKNVYLISNGVSNGSEQVANGAQALAQGATEQASSVEELSATIGEVARQIEASAADAEKANVITMETERIVNESSEAMEQASAAMNEISETSKDISKVIKAIDDIAFQTNILALNAAVEAARAGSAGKGFAVVADEVRNLSQKSAEAAKNTTMLIESSMQAVEKGSRLVSKANEDFEAVAAKSSQVASIVGEISEHFQQQSAAAKQIALGIEQVASVVQINSATSEESAAASEELSSQANVLKNLVAQFKFENDGEKESLY